MNKLKLSHSSRSTYEECPAKYDFKYNQRLRSESMYSALFFGNALDEAFSLLLLSKKKNLTDEELDLQLTKTAEEVFLAKMTKTNNDFGEEVELPLNPICEYYYSDFDSILLNKECLEKLSAKFPAIKGNFFRFWDSCKERLSDKESLPLEDRQVYNYMNWLSLVEKGKLLIAAYRRDILPEIGEVVEIQKRISLPDEAGNEIVGLIDFTATFKAEPGVWYTCDNKTASKPYTEDSARTSEQLATYAESEGHNKVAYVVIGKKLFKTEPKIRTQIIKDTITEDTANKTFDSFAEMVYNVNAGQYPKNEKSCFSYGKICPYYKICKYNNPEGLRKKP